MKRLFALIALLSTFAPAAGFAADPGSAGAAFLRVGLGARASAMGEAYTAVAEDASAVYWNPGAIPAVLGTRVVLAHTEYFASMRLEHAAVTHETDWGTIGLMFTGLYMDDMDRYDDVPTSQPLGTFGAYDVAVAVAYGRYIVPNLAVGLSVKPVYQLIDELSASGIAVDAGVYHVSRIRGVNFAAVVGNLGPPMKFEAEEYALPRYFKVGASYEREVSAIDGRVQVTFDAMFPNDDDGRQHIGAEYSYRRMASLRAGYKAGYDSHGGTFGFGVVYRGVGVDYAFLPVSTDIGDTHRFGLAFTF